MPQAQENTSASTSTLELTDFEQLLDKSFKPKTDEARGAVRSLSLIHI